MVKLWKLNIGYVIRLTLAGFVCIICVALSRAYPEVAAVESQFQQRLSGRVIAVVGENVVTWSDIDPAWKQRRQKLQQTYTGDELSAKLWEAAGELVRERIYDLLLLEEAECYLPDELSKWADTRAETLVKQLETRAGSRVSLERGLLENGQTLENLKQQEKERLLIQELIRRKVDTRAVISGQELRTYYLTHMGKFSRPGQVVIRQIFIRFASFSSKGEAREKAVATLYKLQAGVDFASLARTASEGPYARAGGLWPGMRVADFRAPLAGVVKALKPGQTSDLVETEEGFHIIKMVSTRPAREIPFKEAQHQIRQDLTREKREKLLEAFIASLLEKSYVRYRWPGSR